MGCWGLPRACRSPSASVCCTEMPTARGFPGGPVVKSPPANAGDAGSLPGPGRFHVPWATKPVHHNYWSPQSRALRSATKEASTMRKKPAHRNEACLHSPQLETVCAHSNKDQCSQKWINKTKIKWFLKSQLLTWLFYHLTTKEVSHPLGWRCWGGGGWGSHWCFNLRMLKMSYSLPKNIFFLTESPPVTKWGVWSPRREGQSIELAKMPKSIQSSTFLMRQQGTISQAPLYSPGSVPRHCTF